MMEVIEPGTEVTLVTGLKCIVNSVQILKTSVTYHVFWQSGDRLETQWIEAFLIEPEESQQMRQIGFAPRNGMLHSRE